MRIQVTPPSQTTFLTDAYLTVVTPGYVPDSLLLNGKSQLKRYDSKGKVHSYRPVDGPLDWQTEVVFLKASIEVELANFLPPVVLLKANHQERGRPFDRLLDRYYLPRAPSPHIVEKFFDAIAGEYEDNISPGLNEDVYRCLLRLAKRGLGARPTCNILDYGVGTGIAFRLFGKSRVNRLFGVDMSSEMVRVCHSRGFSRVKKSTYSATPFPSSFFDAVIASFVVHFFVDEKPFCEIARVLKPGGKLAFNLPKPDPAFQHRYLTLLTERGFTRFRFSESKIISDGVTRVIPLVGAHRHSS